MVIRVCTYEKERERVVSETFNVTDKTISYSKMLGHLMNTYFTVVAIDN